MMKKIILIISVNIISISYVLYIGLFKPIIGKLKAHSYKYKNMQKLFYLSMR